MNNKKYNLNKYEILKKIKKFYIYIIFIISFLINYYFYKTKVFIHIFIITILIFSIMGILIYTKKGKDILSYIKMSHKEMQKIIWPEYKETLYTTLIVIFVTIVMSFILWSLDSIIFRLISFIISIRF